ncbi:MAG: polysaccharide biosynthesis tyrosine autokinase [Verrucomicrobia bacterium]|nr:polysaccharide biosynthesis tyrosine autokinase [Verrucomicrobiota bacterium]
MAEAALKPPPVPPPPSDREDEVVERRTLRDYYIILRERVWIALPLALLVAVGYGYWKLREEPRYASFATFQFEKPDNIVQGGRVYDPTVQSEYDINTYIQILGSAKLSANVQESFSQEELAVLRRAALRRAQPNTPPAAIGVPLGNYWAEPVRNSFLIRINVHHDDPEAAALVANHIAQAFEAHIADTLSGKNDIAIKYLREQADRLKKETEVADKKMQDYMKQYQLLALDANKDVVTDRLKRITGNLTDALLALRAVENQVRQIEEFVAQKKSLFDISFISANGAVAALRTQLNTLKLEQEVLADKYLERHPEMIKSTAKIATTQDQLDKAIEQAIAELRTRHSEAQQSVRTFETEKTKAEEESLRLGDLSVEYSSLKREAEAARNNYMQVLDRLNQTRTTTNFDKIPIRKLDAAVPTPNPVSPNRNAITRTSIGLGVLIFIGVAVGLSFIDDRIKSAWDVESFIGANLLGIIPDLAAMKDEEKYTLLLDNAQAPGVEAFLSVYSSIKIHSKLDFPKSILVTSTIPGEGKTLISCNVAGSFARHGKKTLVIDCDLRRPMLHRHFKQQNTSGLITWFEGGASLEGDLANHPSLGIIKVGENLSLLCSGGRSKSPTELLESPVFGQLLERLKREYDLVIVDSPPLGAVTDSLLIAERIDEVVYVCRFNRAYRKHIRLYMRALRNGKNEILGVVLNGLSPRRIEYYSNYRYYRSYKKYYGAQT